MPKLKKIIDVAMLTPEEQTKLFLKGRQTSDKIIKEMVYPDRVTARYINSGNSKVEILVDYMTEDVLNGLIKKRLDFFKLVSITCSS